MGSLGDTSPGSNHPKPWIETPLVYSSAFSKAAGCNIYLKLENIQPSGSFKSRGIGTYMHRALASASPSGTHPVHFFNSSGGNAGLACATAARTLNCPATIVVPTTTNAETIAKLRGLGAEVISHGDHWAGADGYLREVVMVERGEKEGLKGVYVPPFDHPDIWDGASTLADEVFRQLERVDGVVLSVGGGGLLCGMMAGLERERARGGAMTTRVLAVETEGAASLGASIAAGELVTLPAITSIATTLGATRVARRAFDWAVEAGAVEGRGGKRRMWHASVSDRDAVVGCVRLLDEERILVEPACGVTVATAYDGVLRRGLGAEGVSDEEWKNWNVVLVVCGGSTVKLKTLNQLMEKFEVEA